MGTSSISRKGGILEKRGADLENGGYDPLTNYAYYCVWRGNILGIQQIQLQGSYILTPSLHVDKAIQEEFGPTRGIAQLDNGLVIRDVEVIKSFSQGLLDKVTKYAKTVSDVVAPMLEAHIVQTLFPQKRTMACEWEFLCFLQREITQL